MLEQLYNEISEKRLYNIYKNINKRVQVFGTPPPKFIGKIFNADILHPNQVDFTESFLEYIYYNKTLLNFKFSVVSSPSFIILSTDKSNPRNWKIMTTPKIINTFKMPLAINKTYILSCDMKRISTFYNQLLSEMNYMVRMQGFDKQVYFYMLTGVNNPSTDTLTFILRCAIDMKGVIN